MADPNPADVTDALIQEMNLVDLRLNLATMQNIALDAHRHLHRPKLAKPEIYDGNKNVKYIKT